MQSLDAKTVSDMQQAVFEGGHEGLCVDVIDKGYDDIETTISQFITETVMGLGEVNGKNADSVSIQVGLLKSELAKMAKQASKSRDQGAPILLKEALSIVESQDRLLQWVGNGEFRQLEGSGDDAILTVQV